MPLTAPTWRLYRPQPDKEGACPHRRLHLRPPASAGKKLRVEITKNLTPDYTAYARRVGAFRKYLLQHVENSRLRREIMKRVSRAGVRELSRMTLREMKKSFLPPAEESDG